MGTSEQRARAFCFGGVIVIGVEEKAVTPLPEGSGCSRRTRMFS